jgi:hypothetical protein
MHSGKFSPFFIFLLAAAYFQLHAQALNVESYQYLSPLPDSRFNSTETNIVIKFSDAFDKSVLNNQSFFKVEGSKSGIHKGELFFSEEDRTLIFKPENEFDDGEIVTTEIIKNLKSVSGKIIPALRYSFETSEINLISR